MELLLFFWDLLVNLDKHLASLLAQYGVWVYLLLFLIVFCETGLVVTPFLPGDSLLFIAGALTAPGGGAGQIDLATLNLLLIAAAVLGNTTNYWIGRYFGPKVFAWEDSRFFNRRAFDKAHGFYERHGGKTIVITRFLPILRTFAPFVAGVAQMTHARFQAFGCPIAIAVASAAVARIEGASVEAALRLGADEIARELALLPEQKRLAELPLAALRCALAYLRAP